MFLVNMKKRIVLILLAASTMCLSGCSLLTNIMNKVNSEIKSEETTSNVESSESGESFTSEPAEIKELSLYGEYVVMSEEEGSGAAQLSFADCDSYCEDAPAVKLAGDKVILKYTGEITALYVYPTIYDVSGVVEATYLKAHYISLYSEGGFDLDELKSQYNFADDKVMTTCEKNTGFVRLDQYTGDTLYLTLKPDEDENVEMRTVMGLYASRPSRPAKI